MNAQTSSNLGNQPDSGHKINSGDSQWDFFLVFLDHSPKIFLADSAALTKLELATKISFD